MPLHEDNQVKNAIEVCMQFCVHVRDVLEARWSVLIVNAPHTETVHTCNSHMTSADVLANTSHAPTYVCAL